LEEIWRSRVFAARNALSLVLLCLTRSIVAILNVKRHARESGRKRSWQTTVITERTRQRLRSSGAAGIGITGSDTGRSIRPIQRAIVSVRESGTDGDDWGKRLQRWTS